LEESTFRSHKKEMLRFLELSDSEINAMLESSGEQQAKPSKTKELSVATSKSSKGALAEHIFMAFLFLLVAYKLGKGAFMLAIAVLGAFYAYLFIDNRDYAKIRLSIWK
jgi:hypothetical protein